MDYKKAFRIHEDSTVLCVFSTEKYALRIIYDIGKPHLSGSLSSKDGDLRSYIANHKEEAFYSAIDKIGDGCYELNIASDVHFHGQAEEDVYMRMLNIYMPIIQKFMVDALTDTFHI